MCLKDCFIKRSRQIISRLTFSLCQFGTSQCRTANARARLLFIRPRYFRHGLRHTSERSASSGDCVCWGGFYGNRTPFITPVGSVKAVKALEARNEIHRYVDGALRVNFFWRCHRNHYILNRVRCPHVRDGGRDRLVANDVTHNENGGCDVIMRMTSQ